MKEEKRSPGDEGGREQQSQKMQNMSRYKGDVGGKEKLGELGIRNWELGIGN